VGVVLRQGHKPNTGPRWPPPPSDVLFVQLSVTVDLDLRAATPSRHCWHLAEPLVCLVCDPGGGIGAYLVMSSNQLPKNSKLLE
jgi:hypothetical protein